MRTHALAAILCLQWVLWTTPVHGTALAAPASPETPAVASHCAPAAPAGVPAADPEPAADGACLLHCTTFAQAAVSAAASLSVGGLLILPLPGASFVTLPVASSTATLPTRPPGPPARARLLQNSVLRL